MDHLRYLLCGLVLFGSSPVWGDDSNPGAPQNDLTSLSLEQLLNLRVEGAALHSQSLRDAPASVSIITAEDIYKYGYRTLGEALDSARDFLVRDNRTYRSVGVRGFSLPWDYGSRILVMVNGHDMADHVFDSMLWFGDDFPVDMHLIKQIEIIRGPSSALYGSNGEFATINIITKSPEDVASPSLTTRFGSFGEKNAQMMASVPLGKRTKLLLSGTVFNNSGESPLYFPGLDTSETNRGQAIDMDGEKGYHFFGTFNWRNWSVTAVLSNRNKIQPVSWGNTVFNDRGTHVDETANYVETEYTRSFTRGTLRWRAYYNQDRLRGRFNYPLATGDGSGLTVEDNRTASDSDWIGTKLNYSLELARLGTLTAGIETEIDTRISQRAEDVSPAPIEFVNIDRGDKSYALFVQDERRISSHWTLDLGVRFDGSVNRRSFLSPRAALIYQPSVNWTYKFLYGRAFRNPTLFDLFYDDGIAGIANPHARPERVDTYEINIERRIGNRVKLTAAGYGYKLRDFLVTVYTSNGAGQTQNADLIFAKGVGGEIQAKPASWLEATASYAIQDADFDSTLRDLPNLPLHAAKLHFAVPVGRKFDVSSGMQYISSRETLAEVPLRAVYLADFTLTSHRLLRGFDVRAGLRNAFNRRYADPAALNPRVDSIERLGRTFFVELIVHGSR